MTKVLTIENLFNFFLVLGWEIRLHNMGIRKSRNGESTLSFDIHARKEEYLGTVEFHECCCLKAENIAYMFCRMIERTVEEWSKEKGGTIKSDHFEEIYDDYRFGLLDHFAETFDVDEEVKEDIERRIQEAWDKTHE